MKRIKQYLFFKPYWFFMCWFKPHLWSYREDTSIFPFCTRCRTGYSYSKVLDRLR